MAEMERAVALAPSEAKSYATLAVVLIWVGRLEEALKAAEQALRLNPWVADNYLAEVGAVYAAARRHEEAIALLQRYLSRYPHLISQTRTRHLKIAPAGERGASPTPDNFPQCGPAC